MVIDKEFSDFLMENIEKGEHFSSLRNYYDVEKRLLVLPLSLFRGNWRPLGNDSLEVSLMKTAINSLDERFPNEFKVAYFDMLSSGQVIRVKLQNQSDFIVAVKNENNDCIIGLFDSNKYKAELQNLYFGKVEIDEEKSRVIEILDYACREDFALVTDENDTTDYLGLYN